jgi:hypothetical protein
MTQAAHNSHEQYGTLGEVNARLEMLGFAKIGGGQAQTILGQVPRHRLVNALKKAHVDEGARRFLETLIPVASNEPSHGQQRQQTAEHSAQQQGGNNPPPRQNAERPAPQGQQQVRNNAPPPNQGAQQQRRDNAPQNSGGQSRPQNGPSRNAPQQQSQQGQGAEREFISHHVYGGKAALCWDVDKTKNGDDTIRLEAAKAIGERKYDWSSKISIQLTRDELPCVAAVFLGILPETDGRNHGVGDQQGKGFEIQHQGNKLFVKVFAPQKPPCAVPVSPEDAFTVASLLVRQIRKGKPWLSGNDIMTMLRAIIGRMKAKPGNQ